MAPQRHSRRPASRSPNASSPTIPRKIGKPRRYTAALDDVLRRDARQRAHRHNLWFLHRGNIPPKGGIGAHFHNNCEEMFRILNGEAQFTIDGHTSVLKAPPGHRCAWVIPTPSTTTVIRLWNDEHQRDRDQGWYDAFDLGDSRVNAVVEPTPNFMVMRLDRSLLRRSTTSRAARERCRSAVRSTRRYSSDRGLRRSHSDSTGRVDWPSADSEIGGFYYVLAARGRYRGIRNGCNHRPTMPCP